MRKESRALLVGFARRFVQAKAWRWIPGMLRLRDCSPEMRDFLQCEGRVPESGNSHEWGGDWPILPDLTDPATIGCIYHIIRTSFGVNIEVSPARGEGCLWGILVLDALRVEDCHHFSALTEIETLLKAVEGAPSGPSENSKI